MKLLVDKMRELCHAESSGISRLQSYGGEEVFRWVAVAAPPLTSGAAGQGRTEIELSTRVGHFLGNVRHAVVTLTDRVRVFCQVGLSENARRFQ
jgi:hypothetical protein